MSGSMGIVWTETLAGLNQYIADLKEQEGETLFSLTVFDTIFEHWYVGEPVETIPYIGPDRYSPRGSTALYDAIAHTITETEARLKQMKRAKEKVLVVVITDGQENASKDYNLRENGRQRLFDLVKRYEKKGNWTFSYIGAEVDAYAESGAIGFNPGNVVSASRSGQSVSSAFAVASTATSGLRTNSAKSSPTLYTDAGVTQDVTDAALNNNTNVLPPDSPYRSTAAADADKARS